MDIKHENRPFRPRLPDFLKQVIPSGPALHKVQTLIAKNKLKTVCEEAKCPNRTHCYARGTLTFQILGSICTRSCGFCAETFGKPNSLVDASEYARIVETIKELSLKHVVITSPARDDLDDQGAGAFAAVVQKIHTHCPGVTVEILTPDFQGRLDLLKTVFDSRPEIFNHNIETVRRLTPKVRNKASYDRTLFVLKAAAEAGLTAKSGLMVGHGETRAEISETMKDLFNAGCKIMTIGQYLPPSVRHLPLQRVVQPKEFDEMRLEGLKYGFEDVAAGPLVRSSFHADKSAELLFKKISSLT